MNITPLESQLDQFEMQLAFVSDAVFMQQFDNFGIAVAGLQTSVLTLSSAVPEMLLVLKSNPIQRRRVHALAAKLQVVREALMRRQVAVESALAALIPSSHSATYVPKTGPGVRSPYGSVGRQSGEFRAVVA